MARWSQITVCLQRNSEPLLPWKRRRTELRQFSESIRRVQETLDTQAADPDDLEKKKKQALADRKLLESIRIVGWIIVGLLAVILWNRR